MSRSRRTPGGGLRNGVSDLSASASPSGKGDAIHPPFPQQGERPSPVYHMQYASASASWPILTLTRWPIRLEGIPFSVAVSWVSCKSTGSSQGIRFQMPSEPHQKKGSQTRPQKRFRFWSHTV